MDGLGATAFGPGASVYHVFVTSVYPYLPHEAETGTKNHDRYS